MFPYFFAGSRAVHFPQQFFRSTKTYNALMLSPAFYLAFTEYEYILIYQLDAFVFSDKLEHFCSLGYDYIGAPWLKIQGKGLRVGNGGFSLRKVNAHLNIVTRYRYEISQWLDEGKLEDAFFANCSVVNANFHVAPVNTAYQFSAEHLPARCVNKNGGNLPFGCHAWQFMSSDFYIRIISAYGYNLKPLAEEMYDFSGYELRNWLVNIALLRFSYRLQHLQSIKRYLRQLNYSLVRVFNDPSAILILKRLIVEGVGVGENIYIYNEDEFDALVYDLINDSSIQLLITSDFRLDNKIMQLVRDNNSSVVSFMESYLSVCESMFHNLGK